MDSPISKFRRPYDRWNGTAGEFASSPLEAKAKNFEPLILSAMLRFPGTYERLPEALSGEHFVGPEARELFTRLARQHADTGRFFPDSIISELKAGTDQEKMLALYAFELFDSLSDSSVPHAADAEYWAETIIHAHLVRQRRDAHAEAMRAIDDATCIEDVHRSEDVYRKTEQELDDASRESVFKFLSCAELDSGDFSIEYLVDRVLVDGQPCIMAGAKKALKTSVLVDMGLSLATGGHFLGKFPVFRPKRVLFMSGESGLGTIQETARRVARAAHKELRTIDGVFFSGRLPAIGDRSELLELAREIADYDADVLMIDPAYLCLPGDDAGNVFKQGELLRRIHQPCADAGVTMLLAHHTTKSSGSDQCRKPKLSDIAWAGFQEFARQWLFCTF